jgi:hypothetical protein
MTFTRVALNDFVAVFPLVAPDQVKVTVGDTPNVKLEPVTVVEKDDPGDPE